MTHVWIGRRLLPKRHGQGCRLLISRKGKYLVEFEDGHKAVTVRGTFRKAGPVLHHMEGRLDGNT